ncbi:MAG: tetratricopeptide repeat protein [Muribaculaceae bacterium]|nr:tetratricopeptide repeat protein [Muribaculaceae bacterium]
MKDRTKYSLPEQTKKLLEAGRYKDCFTLLRRRLSETPLAGALNQITQSESTYRYLLDYFARGLSDPGREDILADIRRTLRDLAQQIDKESSAADSPDIYFSTLRMCRLRPSDLKTAIEKTVELKAMSDLALAAGQHPDSIMAQIEAQDELIFNMLWTADSLSPESYAYVADAVKNDTLPYTTSSLIISAIGLSLMRYYSHEGLLLLISLSKEKNYKISARALSTLLIALCRWKDEIADDKRLMQALATLTDIDGMSKKIRDAVKTIIRTRDTDRVSKKMQRDVIPGLMQFGPDIISRLKESSEESSFADLEANPEWEELLRNSGLEEKLRELTEMQSDGADVMMVAFSNLKNFPFFRQVRNWFLPFTIEHTMLRQFLTIDNDGMTSLLEMSGLMCDSDKYSLAFSLASMPESHRKMVLSQMQAQTEQMKEQMQELKMLKAGTEFEEELTRYYRDLYRFHKLYPKRGEFYDPFEKALDFTSIPVIADIMKSDDEVATVAEFYFKRGYYADALPLLQTVANESAASPHVWEKIGFCLEKSPDGNDAAIEAYMKAQLFNPDSRWISRRLGICYKKSGDFRNATEYLEMARPEDGSFDKSLSLLIADTLADAKKWDDSLKELYRVDYENPDDPEVIRRMAKCQYNMTNIDSASNLMKRISNIDLTESDYRIMGHIAFLNNDMEEATRFYRLTVRPNDDKRMWKSLILADIESLTHHGASRSDLILLLESIAYSIE